MIPKGITRSRAFRFNVARLPATPTRPSRGPWLAIGLCCPDGSSLTTASSATLNSSSPLMNSRRSLLHPRKSASRWESRGSPIYSAGLCSRAASHTPVAPKSAIDCYFPFGFSLHHRCYGFGDHIGRFEAAEFTLSLSPWLMLRPASWLALLSRTFTFELSLAGSPWANVEYNYVGKQSIPMTGLSPASPTALWAAEQGLVAGPFQAPYPSQTITRDFCRKRLLWLKGLNAPIFHWLTVVQSGYSPSSKQSVTTGNSPGALFSKGS